MAGIDVGGMDLYRIVTMQSVLASTLLVQYVKEYSVHNPLPTCPHSTPQGTFNLQVCLTLLKSFACLGILGTLYIRCFTVIVVPKH